MFVSSDDPLTRSSRWKHNKTDTGTTSFISKDLKKKAILNNGNISITSEIMPDSTCSTSEKDLSRLSEIILCTQFVF